jgi:hypothetical protein
MRNLVNVSLILLVTIIIGVTLRYTMFGKFMNMEGFEDASKKEDETPKEAAAAEADKKEPVQLDTEGNLKNFLNENGNNKHLMSSLTEDTQAMMKNQKELMDMMRTVQPALQQGMEFMKAFKGMMGPAN